MLVNLTIGCRSHQCHLCHQHGILQHNHNLANAQQHFASGCVATHRSSLSRHFWVKVSISLIVLDTLNSKKLGQSFIERTKRLDLRCLKVLYDTTGINRKNLLLGFGTMQTSVTSPEEVDTRKQIQFRGRFLMNPETTLEPHNKTWLLTTLRNFAASICYHPPKLASTRSNCRAAKVRTNSMLNWTNIWGWLMKTLTYWLKNVTRG